MKMLIILLIAISIVYSRDWKSCLYGSISIERAISIAKSYVGKPYKAWISKSKRTGECYWKVRGTEGYVILDAKSGELIKFYRRK